MTFECGNKVLMIVEVHLDDFDYANPGKLRLHTLVYNRLTRSVRCCKGRALAGNHCDLKLPGRNEFLKDWNSDISSCLYS